MVVVPRWRYIRVSTYTSRSLFVCTERKREDAISPPRIFLPSFLPHARHFYLRFYFSSFFSLFLLLPARAGPSSTVFAYLITRQTLARGIKIFHSRASACLQLPLASASRMIARAREENRSMRGRAASCRRRRRVQKHPHINAGRAASPDIGVTFAPLSAGHCRGVNQERYSPANLIIDAENGLVRVICDVAKLCIIFRL